MNRFTDWLGLLVYGGIIVLGLVPFLLRPVDGVSEGDCVDLWNEPANSARRALVVVGNYRLGVVETLFSEGRYEGCAYTFGDSLGRGHWLMFAAVRIPGRDQPLRFDRPWRGLGHEVRTPIESLYRLDRVVMPGGELADA